MKKQILNTDSYSPLYKQLMQKLRSDIQNGVYPVHSRIPSEQELCDTYQVSRVTVRKALAELTQEGLLNRHQGKGTFVKERTPQKQNFSVITSCSTLIRSQDMTPSKKILFEGLVPCSAEIAQRLGLAEGDPVLEYTRV